MYLQREFAALRSCQKRGGMGIGVSGGIRRVYLDPMDVFASFFAGERRDPFASMAFGVTENQRQQEQAGCSSFGGSTPHLMAPLGKPMKGISPLLAVVGVVRD